MLVFGVLTRFEQAKPRARKGTIILMLFYVMVEIPYVPGTLDTAFCFRLVEDKIKREPWYNLIDNLMAETTMQKTRKGPRPFVTFVPNDKRELIQLTFDLSYFERSRKSEVYNIHYLVVSGDLESPLPPPYMLRYIQETSLTFH